MSAVFKVPFFDYQAIYRQHGDELMEIIRGVMSRGAFIMQKELSDFESSLASYLGVKHAVGVANCTDGLLLALRAAGIKQGDEVIFPSHTFVATAGAIHYSGATPVPVDCSRDHLIDPQSVESAITDKTRAIMPVQLNGRTANMDAIEDIARRHGLIIIEDAAQSLASMFKGKKAGTFGLAAAFSFYPAKTLGCLGDGGAVVTDDDEVAEKLLAARDHGRNSKTGEVEGWGINSRLDNLQAAVLSYMLDHYDDIIKRRRKIAAIYQEHLGAIEDLLLPEPPSENGEHFDIFQNYEIESSKRDDLKDFLSANNVGTLVQWSGKAVHQFKALGLSASLPYTEQMFSRSLMLPLNMGITDDEVVYVCNKVREFYHA